MVSLRWGVVHAGAPLVVLMQSMFVTLVFGGPLQKQEQRVLGERQFPLLLHSFKLINQTKLGECLSVVCKILSPSRLCYISIPG